MPAATGTCLKIVRRTGAPSQPAAARKRRSASAARLGPSTPWHTTSSSSPRAGPISIQSARVTGSTTEASSCLPSRSRSGPR